jgi:hypothetical protein
MAEDDNVIKDSLGRSIKYTSNKFEDVTKQIASTTTVIKEYDKATEKQKDSSEALAAGIDDAFQKLFEISPELRKEYEEQTDAIKEQIKQINESISQGKVDQTTANRTINLQKILLDQIKSEIEKRKSLREGLEGAVTAAQKAGLADIEFSANNVNIVASNAAISSGLDNSASVSSSVGGPSLEVIDKAADPGTVRPEMAHDLGINDLKKTVDRFTKATETNAEAIEKQNQKALEDKKKSDTEKILNSAQAKLTDIVSMVTAGASILQLLFKGSAKDAIVFGKEMRSIAYEIEGIGSSTRGLQDEFANLGKNITQQTGHPLEVMQESYMKNIKKGMIQQNKSTKSQKEGLKVIKSGLNLSYMIGANSENTADLFGDWHRTLKLSSQQMAQLSRDTKQIARSTGVTGDHLIEAMKSSEGILKNLQNQGNLTNSAMKNVIKAMTEAKKLGVDETFGKVGDALSSTNKLFFEADDKTKAFLFQMAGRMGEFDSMSAGTFMKSRSRMKKMGEGMESMMMEMAQGLGADVKTFEDLNKLTDTQRRDLAIQLKARTGMEIAEFEKTALTFKKGGESLGDTLAGFDKIFKSSVSTVEERRKAQEDMDKTLMQGGLSMLNSVSEQISKTGGDVSSALSSLDDQFKKDFEEDVASIAEKMGKDISKLSDEQKLQMAGLASAEKLQKAAGEKGVKVEDFSSQLKIAMKKGDSAGFREIVAKMNEAAEKVDIQDKASVDPIKELGLIINKTNEAIRGTLSVAVTALTFAMGSLGIIMGVLAAEVSALTFWLSGSKFAEFAPSLKKSILNIPAAFSKFGKVFKDTRKGFGANQDSVSFSNWNSIEFYKKLRQSGSSIKEARDKVKEMGGSFYKPGTLLESFQKAGDVFVETITGKAGVISGAFAKASAFIATPIGQVLKKALGPAVVLLGGIKGAMEADSVQRTKAEGAILGVFTGGAKTGSFLSPTLGIEKGTVADKTLGVAGAAAWGAMAGAAFGTFFPPLMPVFAAVGAAVGAVTEIIKIVTEGTDILRNVFKPVQVVVDYIYFIFQDVYDILAGIVTLDLGRVFKGVFNAIGSTLALIPRLLIGFLETGLVGIPKLIMRSISMIWEIPRMLMQSILDGLSSLAENSWVGPIFKTLHDAFKALFDGFMAVWTPISEIFSGIYTVFNDLGVALFGASEGGGILAGAIWILQKAIWGLSYVISWILSPIILLTHVLGFVLKIVGALIKGIITPFQWLYDTLVGHSIIPDLVIAIVSWFAKLPVLIFKSLLAIPRKIGEAMSGIGSYLEGFKDIPIIGPMIAQIGNLVGFIGESIRLLSEGLSNIFNIIQGIFTLDPSKIWEGIKGIGSVIISSLSNVGSFLYDSITISLGGLGSFLLTSLKAAFIDLPTYIFNGFKSALEGIWDWIKSWIPGMKTVESAAGGYSENAAEQAATMAKEGPSTAHAIGGLAGAGADLLQLDVGEAASKAGLALKEGVYAAGENLKNAASSAWGGVKAVGSYLNPFNYFEEGTRKIEEPGLAMLHQGEMVIPADLTNKITAEGNGPFGAMEKSKELLSSPSKEFIGAASGAFVGSTMASPAVTIDIDETLLAKSIKKSFEFTKNLAKKIKNYAGSAFTGMGDYFSDAFAPLTTGFNRSMEAGEGIFSAMSRGIKGQYMSITKGKSISEIAKSAFYNIQNLVPESIKNYAASAFGTIQNLVPESIKNYASSAFSNISDGLSSAFSPMIKGFTTSMEAGEGIFSAMAKGITSQYAAINSGLSNAFSPMIKGFTRSMEAGEGIFSALSRGVTSQYMSITKGKPISEIVGSAFSSVKNLVPESIKNYAASAFGTIKGLVPDSIKNYASSAFSNMSGYFSNSFSPMIKGFTRSMKAGEGLFSSISRGVKAQFMSITKGKSISEIASSSFEAFKKNAPDSIKKYASSAFGKIQSFVPESIKNYAGSAFSSMSGYFSNAFAPMISGFTRSMKAGEGIFSSLSKGITSQYMSITKGRSISEMAGSAFNVIKNQGSKAFSKIQNFASSMFKSAKEKGGGLLEKAKGIVGIKSTTEETKIPGTDGLKNATDAAGSIKGSFENVKQALSNLAEGIKAFANKDVLLGALNLIPAGVGLVAMIPGFVGAKLVEKLNGEKIGESLTGLANGLSQMASGKVLLGSGALVLASLALLAMLPALPVLAILGSMSGLITSGLTSLSVGLSTFGAAAANPMLWMGIAAIGALGIAMIPFGYALSALSPLVIAFGSAINAAFSGIGSVISSIAAGMTMFLGAVSLEKAAGLVAVAGGLAVLSAAMIAFSAATAVAGWVSFFGGDGVVNKIMELAAAGPNLKIFSDSITSMSSGIKEFISQLADLGSMEKNVDKFIEISNKLSSASSNIKIPDKSIESNTKIEQSTSSLFNDKNGRPDPNGIMWVDPMQLVNRTAGAGALQSQEPSVIATTAQTNVANISAEPATAAINNSTIMQTLPTSKPLEQTVLPTTNISAEPATAAINNSTIMQTLPTSKPLEQTVLPTTLEQKTISPEIQAIDCCCEANEIINKASMMPDLSGLFSSISSGLKSAFVEFPMWLGGIIASGLKSVFVDLPVWLGGIIAGGLKSIFVDIPVWLGGMIATGLKSVLVDIPMWLGKTIVSGLKSIFVDLPMWLGGMIASGLKSIFVDLPMWIGGMIIGGIKSIFIDLPMWLGSLVISGIKKIFIDLPMWLGGIIVDGIKSIFIDLPVWLMSTIVGGITSLMGAIPGAIYNALYWAASKVGLGWVVKSLAGGGGGETTAGGKEEGMLSKAGSTVANVASGAWSGVKSAGSAVANAASGAWEGIKGFFGFGKEEVSLESILPLMAEFYKAGVSGSGVLVRQAEKAASEELKSAEALTTNSLFNDKNGVPNQNGIMWVDPMQLVNRNAENLQPQEPSALAINKTETPMSVVGQLDPLTKTTQISAGFGDMPNLALAGSALGLGAQKSRFSMMEVGADFTALGDENLLSLLKKPFGGMAPAPSSAGSGLLGKGAELTKNLTGKITSNPLVSKATGVVGNIASNPLVSKTLSRTLPFLGLAAGGVSGAMQAKETGRSTLEAGVLGAITGDAKTGSTMSKYLGVQEGSTTDKVLGVGGAAATGAMTGAAIGSIIPVVGTALGAGIGGLLGGGAELYKWATEKKVPETPKSDLEKLNNLNASIDGSLAGSQDLLNKHAIPMARPAEVEARPLTEGTADVQPVHLRDIGQTILREKASASSGTGKLQSDELTRMEETAYRQVEELEQIKEGINELVTLMKPRGGGGIAGPSNQLPGSTRDPRRPMHSAVFGKMKFGYPSGTANKDVLRTGE